MQEFNHITLVVKDSVGVLTFNRPSSLNAMNREMMNEIIDALHRIVENKLVRVAVITGNGRAFMAGADIKEYVIQSKEEFQSFQQKGRALNRLIEESEIPFIAAVNGIALGGGFEIALSCDLIIAAKTAVMGLPEVHLGLIPGGGGTQRLLQRTGMNRIKEILFLGQSYSAQQLCDWGLVNTMAEDDILMDTVWQVTDKLKRRPAQSLKEIKNMLKPSVVTKTFEERLDNEGSVVSNLFYTSVAQELVKGFANKNK